MCWLYTMRTKGQVAIFCGASWVAMVSSPAKLRWSRSLKKDSRACKGTSKPVLVAGPGAPEVKLKQSEPAATLCKIGLLRGSKAGQPLLSFLVPVQRLHRPGRNCGN